MKKEESENEILEKVRDLQWSFRIYGIFNRSGMTAEKLLTCTERQLRSLDGISTKSVIEIKEKLQTLGLKLPGGPYIKKNSGTLRQIEQMRRERDEG